MQRYTPTFFITTGAIVEQIPGMREDSERGEYYSREDVDARIAEMNTQLMETGGELGKCQANRQANLETINRQQARIADLEKALRELRGVAHTKDGITLDAYIDSVL